MALFNIDFRSEYLGMNTNMVVVMPQKPIINIESERNSNEKIKTLYLLHGKSDASSGWTRMTAIERYARDMGIAVVMPNAHDSWYTNMSCGFRYFDFVAKELPKICHQFFPQLSTEAKDNIIAGNSMGGYGALKIALNYPEMFGFVGCFSGAFNFEKYIRENNATNDKYWTAVFGDVDKIKESENDIFCLVKKQASIVKNIPIYMWCGEQDYWFDSSEKMGALLKEYNYNVTYNHSEGGHNWGCWDEQIKIFLDWLKGII